MFGIGGFELMIILIVGFILVGDRLPEVAKTLGRALRTFQTAQRDMNTVIKNDVFDPDAEEPFKDPLAALDKMGDVAKKAGSSLVGDFSDMASTVNKKNVKKVVEDSPLAPTVAAAAETAPEVVAAAASVVKGQKPAEKPAESFAERRARYERERAERLAAEAAAAEAAVAEAAAAEAAAEAVVEVAETTQEEKGE